MVLSSGGRFALWIGGAVLATVTFTSLPQAALAQAITVQICKQVEIRQVQAGSQIYYRQCGDRFTTADAYIVLMVHLQGVRQRTRVEVELLDPEQAKVWDVNEMVTPPTDQDIYYSDLWLFRILPLATDLASLFSQNPQLAFRALLVTGKPARERLGEWTLRVRINNGSPIVRKFSLEAVPGAAPVQPTPTATPAP
ncbi:MAG: hypothetical protein ACREJA_02955 [Candidatus Methylomirabilales bacterium]